MVLILTCRQTRNKSFRCSFKGSCFGRKYKTLAIIVLVLSALVTNGGAAPASSMGVGKVGNSNTSRHWWRHPCNASQHRTRHNREIASTLPPRAVMRQINHTYQKIEKIYNMEKNMTSHPINGSLLNLKTKIRKTTLMELRKILQTYAATMYVIITQNLTSSIDQCENENFRKPLNEMKNHMRLLLCEVETAIVEKGEKRMQSRSASMSASASTSSKSKRRHPQKMRKYAKPPHIKDAEHFDCTRASTYRSAIISSFFKLMENVRTKFNAKDLKRKRRKSKEQQQQHQQHKGKKTPPL